MFLKSKNFAHYKYIFSWERWSLTGTLTKLVGINEIWLTDKLPNNKLVLSTMFVRISFLHFSYCVQVPVRDQRSQVQHSTNTEKSSFRKKTIFKRDYLLSRNRPASSTGRPLLSEET